MKTETFDNLSYAITPDGFFQFEQDYSGNLDRIYVHPAQLMHIVKVSGLMDCANDKTEKAIAALRRRLGVLIGRIEELDHYLHNLSDRSHANLDWEMTYSRATLDIAQEYATDLDIPQFQAKQAQEAKTQPDATHHLQMCIEGSEG